MPVKPVRDRASPPAEDLANAFSDRDGLALVLELAHDLRSPLTSILFLAETLLRRQSGPLNEVQQTQIGIIYSAALALIGTASDVIELAQGGDRLDTTSIVPFSITELLEPVRDIVQPMAHEKGIEIRLGQATPDRRLGHPIPLSRVLINLTTNALKFTEEGHVEIVARSVSETRVEFSVRDTGPGIPTEALSTLYEPFRRRAAGRSGYHFSGTGLGLSICRRLVNAMGGELQFETKSGWGTRFYFELNLPSLPS